MARKANTLKINVIDTDGTVDVLKGVVSVTKDHIKWSIQDLGNGHSVTFELKDVNGNAANLIYPDTNTVTITDPQQEVVTRLNSSYDPSISPVYVTVTVARAAGARWKGHGDDDGDPQLIIQP
jgi:hypothetical protein